MSLKRTTAIVLCLIAVVIIGVAAAPAIAGGAASPTGSAAVGLLPTPSLTVTFSGLTGGFLTAASAKLGHTVRIHGKVTPTDLGGVVTIVVQKRVAHKWATRVTVDCAVTATGTYSWKFKPVHRGKFRASATIPPSASSAGATTGYQKFRGYGWFGIY